MIHGLLLKLASQGNDLPMLVLDRLGVGIRLSQQGSNLHSLGEELIP
jgi:hypothetical protein